MSEMQDDRERGPESVFSGLRGRPAPEIDSQRLWRRIEARLTPRQAAVRRAPTARREPALRWAFGFAVFALVALTAWYVAFRNAPPAGEVQLVLLTPAGAPAPGASGAADLGTDPGMDTMLAGPLRLDVRLVRGYDGAPPADVSAAAQLGVGGSDYLADVRDRIATLLPFEEFGIVGAWQGDMTAGSPLDVELSGAHRFSVAGVQAAPGPAAVVRLAGVRLSGEGTASVAADLNLEPDRVYIMGVVPPGTETASLVLLLRARLAGEGR